MAHPQPRPPRSGLTPLPAPQVAYVPLSWLRPGLFRWPGQVILLGGPTNSEFTSTMWKDMNGDTCVRVRRRSDPWNRKLVWWRR